MEGKTESTISTLSRSGMIYGDEVEFLPKIFQGRRVIEIGVYEGYSTNLIAQTATEILDIDTFQADNIPGFLRGKSTLATYLEHKPTMAKYIQGNSHVYGTYSRVQKQWYNGLFVDGDHSYEGCWLDLTIYVPLLTPNSVVVLHDYNYSMFPGVIAAATNYFKRLPDDICMSMAVYYL